MDLDCKAGCAALTMCACSPEVKKAGCPALPELAEAAEHEKNDFMVRAETLLQNEASKKDLKSKKYVERDAHMHKQENIRLRLLYQELQLDISFGIFSLGSFAWKLGSVAWKLSFGLVRFQHFAWQLLFRDVRLGSFA